MVLERLWGWAWFGAGGEGWCLARWRGGGLMERAGAKVEGEGESWWRGLVMRGLVLGSVEWGGAGGEGWCMSRGGGRELVRRAGDGVHREGQG